MKSSPTTADDILTCARRLISAGGYNSFSYADIADVVGIRKASIHHHFPNKVDLVRTLVEQYRKDAEDGIASLERQVPGPLDQLRAYVGYWERCIGDGSVPICLCALLANELPVLPDEVVHEVRAYFRVLSAWLTSLFERGIRLDQLLCRDAPRAEAEAFMAAVHGAMLSARAYGDPKMFGTITTSLLGRLTRT